MSKELLLQEDYFIEGFDPEQFEALKVKAGKGTGWEKVYGAYQNQKILQAHVEGIEEIGKVTCAIVMVEDVRGIIPLEHFGVNTKRQLREFMGRKVAFTVEQYDRENEIFTGSRIEAQKQMAKITLRRINEGDAVPAVITRVTSFALFADIGGIEVQIPIDQVRYGWIDNLYDEYKEGDHILVKIMEIKEKEMEEKTDEESGIKKTDDNEKEYEVIVSAKELEDNPWDADGKAQRFLRGNEYTGVVSGVAEYGIFVRLADGVDSLARHLKFENVKKGDRVVIRVLDVDVKEEQIRSRIVRKL